MSCLFITLTVIATVTPTSILIQAEIASLLPSSASTSTSTLLKAEIALFPLDPASQPPPPSHPPPPTRESLFSGLFLTKLQLQLELRLVQFSLSDPHPPNHYHLP